MKKGISIFFYPLLIMGVLLAFTNSCKKDETKIDPVISWSDPADITFGTVLSTTQLNATADIPGTFVYTPPLGTKLNERLNQVLEVAFTPTDGSVYKTVNKTVRINVVNPVNPIILLMVDIPAGTFIMGSPASEVDRKSDEIEHTVTLSAFKMSKYEITNAQFAAFLNSKSVGSSGKDPTGSNPTLTLIGSFSEQNALYFIDNKWMPLPGYENHPAICVSWYGATEFATYYAGGTLPTEAQWEYACRGNTTTPFNTGACLSDEQANYCWQYPYNNCTNTNTTYPKTTQAVGSYPANYYGLYDMHGNVFEWCSDWYGPYPSTAQTNPTGPSTGWDRVIRGGAWVYDAKYCRSAYRSYSWPPRYQEKDLGFRVVLTP